MGRYYGPSFFKEYSQAFWYPKEWLNSEWSKEKQSAFDDLYNLSVFGWSPFRDEFDRILNERNRSTYFNRNQIDYMDVTDPRNAAGSVVRSAGVTNMVRFSDNIKRLYK